jgi:tetratricopeptide (TPR) repeat protein
MRTKLPTTASVEEKTEEYIEAKDWPALYDYMEQLFPLLMRVAEGWPKPKRISHCIGRAYEELARHYGRLAVAGVDTLQCDDRSELDPMGRLRRVEHVALTLAQMMGWDDVRQRVSYCLGEVYQELGDFEHAQRYFWLAVACNGDAVTAGWALQRLAFIWRQRDTTMAAYFYRWAAELDPFVPAIPYVHLYCCLLLAGRRDVVVSEMEQCEQLETPSLRDLMRLAATKQALGLIQESKMIWSRVTQAMPNHPGYPAPGAWERHVELAESIHCTEKDI